MTAAPRSLTAERASFAAGPGWSAFTHLPAALWVMLWFGIATGPWRLTGWPEGAMEWLHWTRTLFPFLVLAIAGAGLLADRRPGGILPLPVALWFGYGLVGLVSGLAMSPNPWQATYWAGAYLAVIAAAAWYLRTTGALQGSMALNRLSWLVGSAFFAILMAVAGDALIADAASGITGYGVINRVEAGSLPISRASGLGRFAAIPGIVACVYFWTRRGTRRLLALLVFLGAAGVIYILQSRGAIFSFAGAVGFIMLILGGRTRTAGLVILLVGGFLALAMPMISVDISAYGWSHLTRGQDLENLLRLSGRVTDWGRAWEVISQSPFWGWGFQADRYQMAGTHVHNSYLYAMLTAGLPGALLFVAGLAGAWLMLLRLVVHGHAGASIQRATLAQAGGMLVFFTLRSEPEVCGPLYNVDMMIMLPAMFFIHTMHRAHPTPRPASPAPSGPLATAP
jgi:O-antigen ligase